MSIITAVIFIFCMAYDSILWNMIDMAVNILAICIHLYTSEHMMPINYININRNEDNKEISRPRHRRMFHVHWLFR